MTTDASTPCSSPNWVHQYLPYQTPSFENFYSKIRGSGVTISSAQRYRTYIEELRSWDADPVTGGILFRDKESMVAFILAWS